MLHNARVDPFRESPNCVSKQYANKRYNDGPKLQPAVERPSLLFLCGKVRSQVCKPAGRWQCGSTVLPIDGIKHPTIN